MKVIIIEDEALVAKDPRKMLERLEPGIEVCTVLESVKAPREYLSTHAAPDLIFSDIQLSDGVSFEIFKDNFPDSPIIFTTAYDQYAISAFRLNSIDYLLKPIDEDDLKRALGKFRKLQSYATAPDYRDQFRAMLGDLVPGNQKKFKTRFTGHVGKSIVAVPEEQVAYFTKDAIIFLFTHDNKQVVTDYHSLDELDELVDPEKFIRANRQHIISINAIDHIKTHFSGKLDVTLKAPLKAEITVSKEKAGEFRRWFGG